MTKEEAIKALEAFIEYERLERGIVPVCLEYAANYLKIKTKQVKYYDEDESVWKAGEVIVAEQTEPKCQECKWWNPIKRQCTIAEVSECAYEPIPII